MNHKFVCCLRKDVHVVDGFPQVAAGRLYKAGTGLVLEQILTEPYQDLCRVRSARSVIDVLLVIAEM
jgi:hypothetical protein